MSKEQTRTQELKQPKTVQVKLLVPYAIIAVFVCTFAGIYTGWTLHVEQQSAVKAEASQMVSAVSKPAEQK